MIKAKELFKNRNQNLLAILGIITISLVILQIAIFIFFSGQTGALTKINQEKELLVAENNQLEQKITELTSLPALEERAREKGFDKPSQENSWSSVIYLAKQLPIASAN